MQVVLHFLGTLPLNNTLPSVAPNFWVGFFLLTNFCNWNFWSCGSVLSSVSEVPIYCAESFGRYLVSFSGSYTLHPLSRWLLNCYIDVFGVHSTSSMNFVICLFLCLSSYSVISFRAIILSKEKEIWDFSSSYEVITAMRVFRKVKYLSICVAFGRNNSPVLCSLGEIYMWGWQITISLINLTPLSLKMHKSKCPHCLLAKTVHEL